MVIKRVGPVSLAKMMAVLYAVMGLIGGAIFACISFAGSALGFASASNGSSNPLGFLGMGLGVGALIAFPLLYGILGFIGGIISAVIYNFVARMVGGIEVDIS